MIEPPQYIVTPIEPPLTLRDKLAAACLPAIYANMTQLTDRAAELAYEQADEMIRVRDAAGDASKESK